MRERVPQRQEDQSGLHKEVSRLHNDSGWSVQFLPGHYQDKHLAEAKLQESNFYKFRVIIHQQNVDLCSSCV